MTINLAVPYYETDGEYGIIFLVDRKVKVGAKSDDTDVSELDGIVMDANKAYFSGNRIAMVTGKMVFKFENKPDTVSDSYEQVIAASLDGRMQDLPFKVSDDSDFSIFVAEASEIDIQLYQLVYAGGKSRRNDITRLKEDSPQKAIVYINCSEVWALTPPGIVSPNLGKAIEIAKGVYEFFKLIDKDNYKGQEIFALSSEGARKLE